MIIITIKPVEITVEAMQMGIKYHIATYSKNDHSGHTDLDTKRFTIKKHTKNGKTTVFECYLPVVMSWGIEK